MFWGNVTSTCRPGWRAWQGDKAAIFAGGGLNELGANCVVRELLIRIQERALERSPLLWADCSCNFSYDGVDQDS